MTQPIARAMRPRLTVRYTAAGTVVIVACACRTVTLEASPEDILEDVLDEARAANAEQVPRCPHRRHEPSDDDVDDDVARSITTTTRPSAARGRGEIPLRGQRETPQHPEPREHTHSMRE